MRRQRFLPENAMSQVKKRIFQWILDSEKGTHKSAFKEQLPHFRCRKPQGPPISTATAAVIWKIRLGRTRICLERRGQRNRTITWVKTGAVDCPSAYSVWGTSPTVESAAELGVPTEAISVDGACSVSTCTHDRKRTSREETVKNAAA